MWLCKPRFLGLHQGGAVGEGRDFTEVLSKKGGAFARSGVSEAPFPGHEPPTSLNWA